MLIKERTSIYININSLNYKLDKEHEGISEIHGLVVRIANKAAETVPSLRDKRVSPHTVRHATAVHLLRAGVDINTIRAWLGHVSLETTNRYAEVDLEMKAKALQTCAADGLDSVPNCTPSWPTAS